LLTLKHHLVKVNILILCTLLTATAHTATLTATPSTIKQAIAQLGPGDTLQLQPGTYAPIRYDTHRLPSGTSWGNAPRIIGGPGVVVRGIVLHRVRYLIFEHLTIDAAYQIDEAVYISEGAGYIRVQDSTLTRGRHHGVLATKGSVGHNEFVRVHVHQNGSQEHFDHGLYLSAAHNLVADSRIEHNRGYGVHIYSRGQTTAHHNVVQGNQIAGNGRFGIVLSNGTHNVARQNRIRGNARGAIEVDATAPCAVLEGNQTDGRIERRDTPRRDCPAPPDASPGLPPVNPSPVVLPAPRHLRLVTTP
jgi:parallel beta-helix repeat protein